ncbi:hypothetical protein TheveDRAFT_1235 [Thermanaerovibrio velox DSM 12556]|uniref:Uncharacterized protein n=1 Tax=Thermanaerovibrio velox DSM 12556 TaxID=926567 RepID=H0UN71_9BACT|nr:hypothetical protein TheveDRAFT_1235 [Thermanaerovibrio velox DSM 12556]
MGLGGSVPLPIGNLKKICPGGEGLPGLFCGFVAVTSF